MPTVLTDRELVKHPSESLLIRVNFTPNLGTGETLTGTPTVVSNLSGFTISVIAIADAYTDDDGATVAEDKAVEFRVSGGTDEQAARFTVTCGTTGSNTLAAVQKVIVSNGL